MQLYNNGVWTNVFFDTFDLKVTTIVNIMDVACRQLGHPGASKNALFGLSTDRRMSRLENCTKVQFCSGSESQLEDCHLVGLRTSCMVSPRDTLTVSCHGELSCTVRGVGEDRH